MTDQQISAIINALRYTNGITPLQKDILDTWDTLHKNPFDTDSAHKQILSNNVNHLDIFAAINAMPGVIQKSASDLTQNDMVFEACNILSIIHSENDLAIIIALDIWAHHNKRVLRTRTEAHEINLAVKELANSLSFEEYKGNRWLLLYEAEAHSLFPKGVYTPIAMTPFFTLLRQKGIDLYK